MPVRLAPRSRLTADRFRAGRFALATLFALLGSSSLQNATAEGETRTLSFQHTHRDDSITVTFKRNGHYDDDGLKKLNHFLRDWRNDEETRMDPRLFDILWEVQREVGSRETIHIISSYRSPQTNAMLRRRSRGVAQFSQHMLGKAIDFSIPNVALEQLRFAGLRLQRGGVGFYPSSGFVHVDVGNIRHWPRMTHDQLARVFPDGKTVHVPSDGVPLKNYQLALAEVQRRGSMPSETSLAAARHAGVQTDVAPGRGRNLFAKLLGIGKDEEEETESSPPATSRPAARPAPQVAAATAAVPMPRVRPARAGEFMLASATSTPVQLTERPAVPQVPAPAADEAIGPAGERLTWQVGPQAQSFPPRPPRDIEGEPTDTTPTETTASVSSWASNPAQNDRVPIDLVLAYAANPQAEAAEPVAAAAPVASAAPMGALKPANMASSGNATVATKRPAENTPATKIAPRNNDPWLRGIVVTPSVHHSVSVAVLGTPDYRNLRPLMHKPRTTVAMVFSNDPLLGLTSLKFSGPAVTFLPTIQDRTRTAGLH